MSKELLNIEKIKKCILQKNIIWTKHCLNRINQRNILILDVKQAISNGRIIEYYYDDYPYPSCLIIGKNKIGNTIHIVCGMNNNLLYMITAYYPDSKEWKEDIGGEYNGMFYV